MNVNKNSGRSSGFTLIEILIVIAVVGVLAATALTLLNPLEQFAKARDSERKKTLRELGNALERFLIKKGHYPITILSPNDWYSSEPGDHLCCPNGPSNNGDWIPGLLASREITRLPSDPKGGTSTIQPVCGVRKSAYWYKSNASGTCYNFMAHCSPEEFPLDPNDPFFDPRRPTWSWMVCDPPESACCVFPPGI